MARTAGGWQPDPIAGFQRWEEAGRVLIVADRWVDAVSKLRLFEPGNLQRALSGAMSTEIPKDLRAFDRASGRGPTVVLPLAGSDSYLHLRPVRHGGWFGSLLGARLLGLSRPLDELRVTASLAARGAPVPGPALVIAERSGAFWNAAVGTVFERDAMDGVAFLSAAPGRKTLLAAAGAAGRAIRRFHEHGGSHPDLHLGNLLVRVDSNGGSEVIVVDLDRAKQTDAVTPSQRMRELMRLERSVIKRGLSQIVDARCHARFLAEYTRGQRGLRRQLLSYVGREKLRIAFHSFHGLRYGKRTGKSHRESHEKS